MRYVWYAIGIIFFCMPVYAQAKVSPLVLSARGVAIYGYKNNIETRLYQKNQNNLYPVASITKLATAKVVEETISDYTKIYTKSPITILHATPVDTLAQTSFSRDDLLRALLISSSNDAANSFCTFIGYTKCMLQINTFLHDGGYTKTDFINPHGLDPALPTDPLNRMTPYNTIHLVRDIYTHDPFLASILSEKESDIIDQKTFLQTHIISSNEINADPLYKDKIILSKTGRTNRAGENMVFVTQGGKKFDYIVVVFFGSRSRVADGEKILDWLDVNDGEF
ncbi:MAG: serine hydrolase [bacterium]